MAGISKGPLSSYRMDSCLSDPQQELLVVFKEQNLRYVLTFTYLIQDIMCVLQGLY